MKRNKKLKGKTVKTEMAPTKDQLSTATSSTSPTTPSSPISVPSMMNLDLWLCTPTTLKESGTATTGSCWKRMKRAFSKMSYTATAGSLLLLRQVASDPPHKVLVAREFDDDHQYDARYLVVDIAGDLLQVCRRGTFPDEGLFYITEKIVIMKLDQEKNTWSPVKNLGQQSLFLGKSYSMALSAQETPGLKENCIYFTDDGREIGPDFGFDMIRDVGIFNVEDGTIQLCNPPPDIQLKWPPPVWVAPTLR